MKTSSKTLKKDTKTKAEEKVEAGPVPLFLAKDPDIVSYLKFFLYAWVEPEKHADFNTFESRPLPTGLTLMKHYSGMVKVGNKTVPRLHQVMLYSPFNDGSGKGWLFASVTSEGKLIITPEGGYKYDLLKEQILKFKQFCKDFDIKYTEGSF